ncbi:MAG: hypothetical protein IJY89_01635, partial [Clostridia bacterium]|nr:hypothetical protein [Clostridia bacterium]
MKKKTFLLLTALLLLSATLLCSCGGAENLKFSSVVDAKAYVDTTPTLTTATALSMKGRVADYAGTLVLFEEEDTSTISVYSVSEDKVVFTASDSRVSTAGKTEYVDYSVDIMVSEGMVWFSVIKVTRTMDMDTLDAITSDREVSIYDEKGAVLLSGKDLNHSFDAAADLVFFKDKVYRAENGALTEILTLNGLADAPSISKKAGKGYVGTSGKTISLYNERLELVASYIIPSYAADRKSCYVTKNGNVIIQYPVLCEADAQDYDLLLTENENEILHFVDIPEETKESES